MCFFVIVLCHFEGIFLDFYESCAEGCIACLATICVNVNTRDGVLRRQPHTPAKTKFEKQHPLYSSLLLHQIGLCVF